MKSLKYEEELFRALFSDGRNKYIPMEFWDALGRMILREDYNTIDDTFGRGQMLIAFLKRATLPRVFLKHLVTGQNSGSEKIEYRIRWIIIRSDHSDLVKYQLSALKICERLFGI